MLEGVIRGLERPNGGLLEKEFRRLLEILGDLGHIGTELEKTAEIVNLKASEEV